MPSWGEVIREIENIPTPLDEVRRKYLKIMNTYTGRNVITYYSGFIQKPGIDNASISDADKNAFMQCVYGLDKSKGLDLVLHTPGGDIAATESIIKYLCKLFNNDIRVFVPQIAMSAGTMISLAAKEIVLGKQSNLGPIDPQYGGLSCAGIIEEFELAVKDVAKDPSYIAIWQPIISKYHPTFIGDCKKAISWAEEMVSDRLMSNMFKNDPNSEEIVRNIVSHLSSHEKTFSHSRHIDSDALKKLRIKIVDLETLDGRSIEGCKDLQDCVLTLHHAYMRTFETSAAAKIVENHLGAAMINSIK